MTTLVHIICCAWLSINGISTLAPGHVGLPLNQLPLKLLNNRGANDLPHII